MPGLRPAQRRPAPARLARQGAAALAAALLLALACTEEDSLPGHTPDAAPAADLAPDRPPPDSKPHRCGDGLAQGQEKCDGNDLAGQTCQTLGYFKGALACSNACTFELSACSNCGNGKLDKDENCDGALLGGHTCVSLGYASGKLSCQNCHLVLSGCLK